MRRFIGLTSTFLLGLSGLLVAMEATGAPGDLDPTFGNGGKLLDGITRGYDDGIDAAAIQADGKIVAVGTSNRDFALARYNSDGSLDTLFGSGGKVTTAIGSGYDAATSIVIQADGRILAAGQSQIGTSGGYHLYELVVVRYNAEGTLDSAFGSGGIVRTRIGLNAQASAIAIQSDGKIVAVGSTHNSNYNYDDFALVRFNPDGSLDPSFGGDGIVTTSIAPDGPSASRDFANSVAIQNDGRIVAAGSSRTFCTPNGCESGFALARYNSNGSLDGGFGNNGVLLTDIGPLEDIANSVAIQPDGKLVAAGSTKDVNGPRALVRYNSNGSLDSTFGSGGKVLTQIGGAGCGASTVSIRADGRILTAGSAHNGQVWTFALTRHNSDGSLDASFDGDGILMTPIGSYSAGASDIVFLPNGKIQAVGHGSETPIGFVSDFALTRYNPDGSLDSTFDSDGKVTTNFADVFTGNTLYDVAAQSDGKILVVGNSGGYAVARYNLDGSIDAAFGNSNGKVTAGSVGNVLDASVAIQPDGKTVVAGIAYVGDMYDMALEVFRYNSDGTPDIGFGDSGQVILSPATGGDWSDAAWVNIRPDGKIILGGGDRIYRLNPNGSRDAGFGGGDGIANAPAYAYASAILPNGKIVIAGPRWNGSVSNSTHDLVVARLNPDGVPDPTFGSGGTVTIPMSIGIDREIVARTVAIQTDGKIVAGGYRLVRLNENGSLDTGFGSDGIVTPPTGPFRQIVMQSDAKLLTASSSNNDFAVTRYNANGSLDATFGGGDGISTVDFNNSNDAAYGMTLDALGRPVVVGGSDGAFALARVLFAAPGVSISGRVTTPNGHGLRRASVNLIDLAGTTRTVWTSSFGLYSFADVPAGQNYTLTVVSRRYRFTPRTLDVNGTLTGVDLVGLE